MKVYVELTKLQSYPKIAEFMDVMYARQSLQAGIEYMKTMPKGRMR